MGLLANGSELGLTPRRSEALAVLRRLAAENAGAVHYSAVGSAMSISAWTAYGLLRELENAGLARRTHSLASSDRPTDQRRGGRSKILFSPTLPQPAGELVDRLRAAFERFAGIADEAVAVRTYLSEALPGGDPALALGFWLARLGRAGRDAGAAVRAVLDSAAVPAAKIQTLAGMGLGAELIQLGRSRLTDSVTGAVTALAGRLEAFQRSSDAPLAALIEAARTLPSQSTPEAAR